MQHQQQFCHSGGRRLAMKAAGCDETGLWSRPGLLESLTVKIKRFLISFAVTELLLQFREASSLSTTFSKVIKSLLCPIERFNRRSKQQENTQEKVKVQRLRSTKTTDFLKWNTFRITLFFSRLNFTIFFGCFSKIVFDFRSDRVDDFNVCPQQLPLGSLSFY